MPQIAGRIDLCDPRWFPLDYSVGADAFHLGEVPLETIGSATFLDRVPVAAIRMLPAREVDLSMPSAPAFLFHTAFCGSTLLARALHHAPDVVSLKEPRVLLTLAALHNRSQGNFPLPLRKALALLSRPWTPGGSILIKPTNQANNLIGPLMARTQDSRAILLYSSLEEFLVSCFKKLPEAETRVRWMAQHLIAGTRLAANLDISPTQSFNLVESCVLAWYAQMELYARALATDTQDRIRTLDMRVLLASPCETVRSCSRWLGLKAGDDPGRISEVFARDSKLHSRVYDSARREEEKILVREAYGPIIQRACEWAHSEVAPAAMVPNVWKALDVKLQQAATAPRLEGGRLPQGRQE